MPLTIREIKIINVNDFTLTEGKRLEMKTKMPTEEILALEVPEGESWAIEIHVRIEISD